MRGRIKSGKKK